MTSILYSWPWSICLSTCGIKYGGGNIQLFTLAQEKVNASMPSAQGFKPVTAETRDLACLEGREPVDSVRPPQNTQGCKNIWVKDVVIIVHLSRQACSFGHGLPTLRMFSMLMLSVLWHTFSLKASLPLTGVPALHPWVPSSCLIHRYPQC